MFQVSERKKMKKYEKSDSKKFLFEDCLLSAVTAAIFFKISTFSGVTI